MSILATQQNSTKQLLADPETYGTVLLVIFADHYADATEDGKPIAAFQWAPETIQLSLEQDFNLKLPALNRDKLMAAISVATSDEFYTRLSRFIQICNVLSGAPFDPFVFDPANAKECAWGMTEALLISPPEEDEPFAEDIRHYIGKVLDDEGIKNPPDLLKIGLRDTPSGLPDYSGMFGDPEMFSGMFQVQQEKSDDITAMLQANLSELFSQLGMLRLHHGSTEDLVNQMRNNLSDQV